MIGSAQVVSGKYKRKMLTPQIEQKFGKYRILREIGRGGMGVVYLAEDETLGRHVALKVLHRAVTARQDFEHRFRLEARTIARLNHPNVVQIHALEQVDEDLAIDMAYVEGGSLADAEQAGRLEARQAVAYVRDVLLALACCHEAGIVHRDVKPSNILLSPDGRALLSDFGLAKLLAEYQTDTITSSTSNLILGTPRYAPPESWDACEPAPAWDVYSVGMVLFEAIESATPYDADTPLALMKQMLERPIPRLRDTREDISEELGDLVERMLQRDPGMRPQDAGEALELLQKAPESRGDAGANVALAPRRRPRRFRRRVVRNGSRPTVRAWPAKTTVRRVLGMAIAALALIAIGYVTYSTLFPGVQREEGANTGLQEMSAVSIGAEPNPESGLVFDAVDLQTQAVWPAHWMMRQLSTSDGQNSSPIEWQVIAWESTHLWFLSAKVLPDNTLAFDGHWAEYTDTSARVFRYGSLAGTGRWYRPGEDLTVSLTFQSGQDGSTWSRSFSLKRSASAVEASAYLADMESADYIQPILYNELAPRNVPWLRAFETEMLGRGPRRAIVAGLHPEFGSIHVDGRLDEPAWKNALHHNNEEGALPGKPEDSGSALSFRYSGESLFVGVHAGGVLNEPRLVISLQNGFSLPMGSSPRWSVQVEDGKIVASRHVRGARELPWECHWQVATRASEDAWEAEIVIPFADLDDSIAPRPGRRWRLNCTVENGQGEGGPRVIRWGAEKISELEHGAVLVFGERLVAPEEG